MPERRSPLDGWSLAAPGLAMRELPHLAQVSVRAATAPSGPALPLGPDEWLVLGPSGSEADMMRRLQQELAGSREQILDLTASRTTIELAGPRAREVLEMGCGLDLHSRAFPPGRSAATLLARTGVILQRDEAWRIHVRRSFARYLRDWLMAAAHPAAGV